MTCVCKPDYFTRSEAEVMMQYIIDLQKSLGCNNTETDKNENGRNKVDMPISDETKTIMAVDERNVIRLFKRLRENEGKSYDIMPDIVNIRVYDDNAGNPHAVYVDFVDGTTTNAVLHDNDTYNLEHAFSVCITKKLLDQVTEGCGHQVYNKLVRHAGKVYEAIKEADEKYERAEAERKRRIEKNAEKKRKREQRRLNAEREAEEKLREDLIEIQKEAFLRAFREMHMTADDLK